MDITLDVFNRETGQNLGMEDITEYDLGNCYGITKEDIGRIWQECHSEITKRSIPIMDLYEFMDMWERYGQRGKNRNEIIIVTARPEEEKEDTLLWLKNNRVRYDEIYFGYESKIKAVQKYFLDVFVDDREENIRGIDESEELRCEAFLVDRPYNRTYQTNNRIYTQGVEDLIELTK